MPYLADLDVFDIKNGNLVVFEKLIPGNIKRVFFIYGVDENQVRGGHRHFKTWSALFCIQGCCRVYTNDGQTESFFELDNPHKCLILEPKDWHTMDSFSSDAILMVLASEYYEISDYIDEPYSNTTLFVTS